MRAYCHSLLFWFVVATAAAAPDRVVESVLPALAYGPLCSSSVVLRNLSDTSVTVELQGHHASGARAPVLDKAGETVELAPGQQASYKLDIEEETTSAWVEIRERIPAGRSGPAVALSGATECRNDKELRVASREVAYPTRNPWISGDTAELRGAVITLINTTEAAARATVCYSTGSLVSVLREPPASELVPLCSEVSDVQIPPFGTREFPVERGGNSHFALRTHGEAIVLQMLRRLDGGVRIFKVDSTIEFGEEVAPAGPASH